MIESILNYRKHFYLQFNDEISNHRTLLMGAAIIWICFFHQDWTNCIPGFYYITGVGLFGVEIFLFVSGFGIYKSLKKNDIKTFSYNRAKRILPPVALCELLKITLCLGLCIDDIVPLDPVRYLVGIHLWYVKVLIVYYVLSPYLLKCLEKYGMHFLYFCYFIALATLLMPRAWLLPHRFLTRLPIFVMGMACMSGIWKISFKQVVFLSAFPIIAYIMKVNRWDEIMKDSPIVPLILFWGVPSLIFFVSNICKRLPKIAKIILIFLGECSLEIYIWHENIFSYLRQYTDYNGLESLAIGLSLTVILAYVTHLLANKIKSLL